MAVTRWVRRAALVLVLTAAVAAGACRDQGAPVDSTALPPAAEAFLDTLEHRTFLWFWELSHPETHLVPDRAPTPSFASLGAQGFGLTAIPIGIERGWITRAAGRERVLASLRFLWRAPQDTSVAGAIGWRGFFYHFVDPATGLRFRDVELSTVDTALLMAGALFCQSYFDGGEPAEAEIRALADSLYLRVDWRWAQVRPPTIVHGWDPEEGFLPYDWRGYSEATLLPILALGSPTHAAEGDVWGAWTEGYRWGEFQGREQLGFAPLFGHQYTHCWIDFRGIHDPWMRDRGIDYFENSRRATYAQRAYAVENDSGWRGYGENVWGLTACDGPHDTTVTIEGRVRSFRTYAARGASFLHTYDDGTIAPTAAGGSLAFAPEIALPALLEMRRRHGDRVWNRYGFVDAFNPTLTTPMPLRHGRIEPGEGWFDTDQLGIDQGPILLMAENLRTGLVWERMRRNPHVIRGLRRAGFTGGWLDAAARP